MKTFAATLAVVATSVVVSTGHGQDASVPSSASPPDLVGTWEIVRSEGAFGT